MRHDGILGLARGAALAAAMNGGGLTACGGGAAGSRGGDVEVVDQASARAAVGKRVSIEGAAGNGKIALVVTRDDLIVYCLDQRWKQSLAGRRVRVRGTLEITDQFRASEEGGNISQGTRGGDLVIRRCEIE
jgi:hypothetical protein